MSIRFQWRDARDFNQDISGAKKAARDGPVIITNRGRPTHVLLSIEQYLSLTKGTRSIADCLAMPEAAEIELPLEPVSNKARRAEY